MIMFFTEIGLTQYEIHDNFNPLEEYNRDMRTITTTTTVAAGRVDVVEQESKDRDEALQNDIDTNHNGIVTNANDISELKAKDIELEDSINLNRQGIETLQVTTSSISAQLLSHIETSTSFSAAILEEVKDNYTELKTDIAADRERLAVAETAIANIENGDTEIAGRVTELERDNRDNKNAIEALQLVDQSQGESIQDLHNRMITAESNITVNANNIVSVDNRVITAEQNIEDLQKRQEITASTTNANQWSPALTFSVGNIVSEPNFAISRIYQVNSELETIELFAGAGTLVLGHSFNMDTVIVRIQAIEDNMNDPVIMAPIVNGDNLWISQVSKDNFVISRVDSSKPIKIESVSIGIMVTISY